MHLKSAAGLDRIPDPAIQLGLSHFAAGIAASGLTLAFRHAGAPAGPSLLAAGFLAAAAGIALNGWFIHSLVMAERWMARLASGQTWEYARSPVGWPVAWLLDGINALGRRLSDRLDGERQAAGYHQELVRQVSEAAVQEERKRMARDLHDSIKQQIFGMAVSAATAEARWESDPAGARAALAAVRESAHEAQMEMQALLQQLRPTPLESIGLVEALRIQLEALGYRSGTATSLELGDLPPDVRLPPGAQDAVFRVAQEAFANVARHARAEHVTVKLYQTAATLELQVIDDGQGFEPSTAPGGMGLANIRERVRGLDGTVRVESMPGAGTTLHVSLPLAPAPPVQAASAAHALDVGTETARRVAAEAVMALKSGTSAAVLAAILILFAVDVGLVLACVALAAFQCCRLWAAGWRMAALGVGRHSWPLEPVPRWSIRVGLNIGMGGWHGPGSLPELEYRSCGLLSGVLALVSLCSLYLSLLKSIGPVHLTAAAAYAASGVFAGLALVVFMLSMLGSARQLRDLAPETRRYEIKARLVLKAQSLGGWLFVVVCSALWGFGPAAWPVHTADQWANDSAIAILIAWPVLDLVEYVHLKYLQPAAKESATVE